MAKHSAIRRRSRLSISYLEQTGQPRLHFIGLRLRPLTFPSKLIPLALSLPTGWLEHESSSQNMSSAVKIGPFLRGLWDAVAQGYTRAQAGLQS